MGHFFHWLGSAICSIAVAGTIYFIWKTNTVKTINVPFLGRLLLYIGLNTIVIIQIGWNIVTFMNLLRQVCFFHCWSEWYCPINSTRLNMTPLWSCIREFICERGCNMYVCIIVWYSLSHKMAKYFVLIICKCVFLSFCVCKMLC